MGTEDKNVVLRTRILEFVSQLVLRLSFLFCKSEMMMYW